MDCDDDDLCTIDSCDKVTGCKHTLVEGPCNTRNHVTDALLADNSENSNNALLDHDSALLDHDREGRPELTVTAISLIVTGVVVGVALIAAIVIYKVKSSASANPSDDSYQKMN
jgi:hypothetical protein